MVSIRQTTVYSGTMGTFKYGVQSKKYKVFTWSYPNPSSNVYQLVNDFSFALGAYNLMDDDSLEPMHTVSGTPTHCCALVTWEGASGADVLEGAGFI